MERIEFAGHSLLARQRALAGQESTSPSEQFGDCYEACFATVLGYVYSHVRSREVAEDLTADTFERALRGWHRFEGRSDRRVWLLGIARHVVLDHQRRAKVGQICLKRINADASTSVAPSSELVVESRQEAAGLGRALGQLSPSEQELIRLRYATDMSFRQIGELVKANEGTVRVRLHRALHHLREILDVLGGDGGGPVE